MTNQQVLNKKEKNYETLYLELKNDLNKIKDYD